MDQGNSLWPPADARQSQAGGLPARRSNSLTGSGSLGGQPRVNPFAAPLQQQQLLAQQLLAQQVHCA